jgi:4-hydroxybenzoate polyprenyltransferase
MEGMCESPDDPNLPTLADPRAPAPDPGPLPAPGVIRQVRELSDMIKFEHTVFALPFALLAAMATTRGLPPAETVLWILAAMVGARTAAMTFNRLADHDLDEGNPRTRERALPAGRVSRTAAYALLGLAIALFAFAAGRLGPLPWKLAPLALVIILGYSYCKRFTLLSHVVLGLSLAGAPLGAWIAVNGQLDAPAWYLALGVLTWTAGFDILYALQDLEFDRERGLHSIPARLGVPTALALSRLLHLAALLCWGAYNVSMEAHLLPWLGWITLAAILVREQWVVRGGNLERIDHAFFTLNSLVGPIFFLGHLAEWVLSRLMP